MFPKYSEWNNITSRSPHRSVSLSREVSVGEVSSPPSSLQLYSLPDFNLTHRNMGRSFIKWGLCPFPCQASFSFFKNFPPILDIPKFQYLKCIKYFLPCSFYWDKDILVLWSMTNTIISLNIPSAFILSKQWSKSFIIFFSSSLGLNELEIRTKKLGQQPNTT